MGFGLCNAPATFFRHMNDVLQSFINKFVFFYLDYICIYFETREQHIEYLWLALQKLCERQYHIKMPKCFWGRKETQYFVDIVGNGTLRYHLIKFHPLETDLCQKLKSILNHLSSFVLTMVSSSTIFRIVLRH